MRIVYLTAGTGSFHCGTCMRDNTLVTELRKLGHDALLVPLYLPMVLDEPSAAEGAPLFYGGINVYLQQKSGLFRKTPRWLDRLLDVPSVLHSAAKKAGMTSPRDLGEITLSMLRGEEGNQVKELNRLTEWLQHENADVVVLSNALLIGAAREIKRCTGAIIASTLQGEDTFLDSLHEPYRTQCWELLAKRAKDVDLFLPVSRYHGELMARRARLPEEKVRVLYPGIHLDGFETAPQPLAPPVLGFLSRMHPTKGIETLVEAFVILRANDRVPQLKVKIAGSCTAGDEALVEKLKQRLAGKGLASEVEFLANLDREQKIAFLKSLTVLSVPATYGESFGLYVLEALAVGVPVVQPRHAAFPEIIEATGGGILCEGDDPLALASAVEELLSDPPRAREMGLRGRKAVLERFSAERMAKELLAALGAAPRAKAMAN